MDTTCYTFPYIPQHHYPWCSGLRPRPCRISCRQNIYFCLIRRLIRQKYHFSVYPLVNHVLQSFRKLAISKKTKQNPLNCIFIRRSYGIFLLLLLLSANFENRVKLVQIWLLYPLLDTAFIVHIAQVCRSLIMLC